MSLDSLATQQTLFGRACAEGICRSAKSTSTAEAEFYVRDAKRLLVGDLAEYVIRRVRTDSAQLQKPWAHSGTEWMGEQPIDRTGWPIRECRWQSCRASSDSWAGPSCQPIKGRPLVKKRRLTRTKCRRLGVEFRLPIATVRLLGNCPQVWY